MQDKLKIISSFPTLRLSKKQIKLLKKANNTKLSRKARKEMDDFDTCDGLFRGPDPSIGTCGMLEYIGIVPEDVLTLAELQLLEIHDPSRNPISNDDLDKCYFITEPGKMYLRHLRYEKIWETLPVVISITSLILSLINLWCYIHSLHQILQVHLI